MKTRALILLTALLAFLTTASGLLFLSRLGMEYNSEGTYFDENSALVYHEQAVLVFGAITFILLLLTLLAAWKIKSFASRSMPR